MNLEKVDKWFDWTRKNVHQIGYTLFVFICGLLFTAAGLKILAVIDAIPFGFLVGMIVLFGVATFLPIVFAIADFFWSRHRNDAKTKGS